MPINREVNNTHIDRCDDATRRDATRRDATTAVGCVVFFLSENRTDAARAGEPTVFFRRAAR
jgi:hypothetical protein